MATHYTIAEVSNTLQESYLFTCQHGILPIIALHTVLTGCAQALPTPRSLHKYFLVRLLPDAGGHVGARPLEHVSFKWKQRRVLVMLATSATEVTSLLTHDRSSFLCKAHTL
jgi:hypothetical protein